MRHPHCSMHHCNASATELKIFGDEHHRTPLPSIDLQEWEIITVHRDELISCLNVDRCHQCTWAYREASFRTTVSTVTYDIRKIFGSAPSLTPHPRGKDRSVFSLYFPGVAIKDSPESINMKASRQQQVQEASRPPFIGIVLCYNDDLG